MQIDRAELEAWQRDQPLSILQLDPADRAVLRVAGGSKFDCRDLDGNEIRDHQGIRSDSKYSLGVEK